MASSTMVTKPSRRNGNRLQHHAGMRLTGSQFTIPELGNVIELARMTGTLGAGEPDPIIHYLSDFEVTSNAALIDSMESATIFDFAGSQARHFEDLFQLVSNVYVATLTRTMDLMDEILAVELSPQRDDDDLPTVEAPIDLDHRPLWGPLE